MTPSRQYKWANDRIAAGLCGKCGKPRTTYAEQCDDCAERDRKRRGVKNAWQPGKRGRPPKNAR